MQVYSTWLSKVLKQICIHILFIEILSVRKNRQKVSGTIAVANTPQ